ncbi:MAG: hypothetical protein FIB00_04225 [Chloroflexi bacterium]|nr:hypothetical protein [Chloroflexota bacterium]PWB45271.1 MAG: hypothetical protein C3F10_08780 [Dehalococcoidia bacterium]
MAEKDFEADDPLEFVAVRYPVDPTVDSDAVMARCFIEEYALFGTPPEQIAKLFRSPFFAGTNAILKNRGPEFVQGIIDDVFRTGSIKEVS